MRPINSNNNNNAAMETSSPQAPLTPPAMAQPRSPWHSPVPYLFGGLAAMLGLIAFALLILACSYWRLSGRLDNNGEEEGEGERDVESGEKEVGDSNKPVKVYEEKILVIMAGQEKPTFLATPASTKAAACFGDDGNGKVEDKEGLEKAENGEKVKEEEEDQEMSDDHHHDQQQLPTITENSEHHESQHEAQD